MQASVHPATRTTSASSAPTSHVDLALEGMTCAACAVRIEKVLNRVPGAQATVNLATETAAVRFDPTLATVDALVGAVGKAGYTASVREDAHAEPTAVERRRIEASRSLRRDVVIGALLTAPLLLPMVQMLSGDARGEGP